MKTLRWNDLLAVLLNIALLSATSGSQFCLAAIVPEDTFSKSADLAEPASSSAKISGRKSKKKEEILSSQTVAPETIGVPCISWIKPLVPVKAALLCIHGLGLYSGAYRDFGMRMARNGIATFAIDVRGFGSWMKTPKEEDLDFDGCLSDIKSAVDSIHFAYPGLPIFLLGESMGGAIALRFASMHPATIDGLISSVPSGSRFKQKKTDVKVAVELIEHRNKEFDIGDRIINQATQNEQLRHDWGSDPMDRMDLSAKQLLRFQHFMNENHESAKQLSSLPVLFVQGTQDKLVKPESTWELFNELATPHKVFLALPSEHLVFEENQDDDEMIKTSNECLVTAWIFAHTIDNSRLISQTEPPELLSAITKLVAGQYFQARKSLELLANNLPNSSEIHYWLGVAYFKCNQPFLARRQFSRSMALSKGPHPSKAVNDSLLNTGSMAITASQSSPDSTSTTNQALVPPELVNVSDLSNGKPLVLAFYANWCEQCDRVDSLFQQGKSMFGDQVKFLKVDIDDPNNKELVNEFTVAPIPTLIYVKKDGSVAATSIGQSGLVNFASGLATVMH